jgi:hypothetical protein
VRDIHLARVGDTALAQLAKQVLHRHEFASQIAMQDAPVAHERKRSRLE